MEQLLPQAFNSDKFAINDIAKILSSSRSNIDAIKELKPFIIKTVTLDSSFPPSAQQSNEVLEKDLSLNETDI